MGSPAGVAFIVPGGVGLALGHDQTGIVVLKRILIIPASFPPVLGGVQTVTHRLGVHLVSRGVSVEVLTRRQPRTLRRKEELDGIPVTRRRFYPSVRSCLRQGRPDLGLASLLTERGDQRSLQGILDRHRPECVNIHFPDWQVGLIPQIRANGVSRLVVSLHGDEVMRAVRGDPDQRTRLSVALREADQVTACSAWLLEQACAMVPETAAKACVAWNGIDTGRFTGAVAKAWPRPYVLGFGRFVTKKGFDLLIEAFAGLGQEDGHDLVLVGSGPELEQLRIRSTELGVQNRVHFPGRAFGEEMVSWIRGAHLAVVPSREEPFGITALEVAAAGVPLVATAVGGMPEYLESFAREFESIVICEPETASIGQAIRSGLALRADPEKREAQLQRVRETFDWGHRLAIYDSVLETDGDAESVK